MPSEVGREREYALAQSDDELQRLMLQDEILESWPTRRLFEQAGISTGMRVVDVGCGAGDVSFLAAELVGPSGKVVGIDSSTLALNTARTRASAAGLNNVSFVEGDLHHPQLAGEFDALVGRLILMHLAGAQVPILKALLRYLRPGSPVAFREHLIGEAPFEADPPCELIDEFNSWYVNHVVPRFGVLGLDGHLAFRMQQVFKGAGLPAPQIWMYAPIGSEPDWKGWQYLNYMVRMIAGFAGKVGVRLPALLSPDDFGQRVRDDILSRGGALRLQRGIQAWTRTLS